MNNRRSIEMLWGNEGKLVTVALRIEEFIDQVSVAETKMVAESKQLGRSRVDVPQLGEAGRTISCTP
jgi:hypothetical protein